MPSGVTSASKGSESSFRLTDELSSRAYLAGDSIMAALDGQVRKAFRLLRDAGVWNLRWKPPGSAAHHQSIDNFIALEVLP